MRLSNDGGATWTTKTKYKAGNADNRPDSKSFFFVENGQFFTVQVEWASTTTDFQFLGANIVYDDNGEEFDA
jgi:hypothetical protein